MTSILVETVRVAAIAVLLGPAASPGGCPHAQGPGAVRLDPGPWNGGPLKGGASFGAAVAATDGLVLVGAPHDHAAGWHAGAVYVFEGVGPLWLPLARWTADDAQAWDQFGRSVAIAPDGGTGYVGAWLAEGAVPTSGAVYVFEREAAGWRQTAKLWAAGGAPNDGFGSALAADAGRLVVGACYADRGAFLSGSAYVFEAAGGTWQESTELAPSETGFLAGFGAAMDVEGDRIAVGAPRADTAGTDSGAVFLFERGGTGWSQIGHLAPPAGSVEAHFGEAVSLAGDELAVGAPGAEATGVRAGRVTVFATDGLAWTPAATLQLAAPAAGDGFGAALHLARDTLIAGAPGASSTGAVLRFARAAGGWRGVATFARADGRPGDGFGSSVAAALGDTLVGAPGADVPTGDDPGAGADVGVTWVFD